MHGRPGDRRLQLPASAGVGRGGPRARGEHRGGGVEVGGGAPCHALIPAPTTDTPAPKTGFSTGVRRTFSRIFDPRRAAEPGPRPDGSSTGSTTERRRGLDRLDHRAAAWSRQARPPRAGVVSTGSTTEGWRGLDRLDHRAAGVVSTGSTTEGRRGLDRLDHRGLAWSRQARPQTASVPTRGRSRGTGILECVTSLDPAIAGRLKRSADGLVPAVAQQHDTGEVLMLGWMDDEALARTLTTGRATYWSRSRAGVLGQGRHLRPRPVGQGGPARLRRRHPARPGRPGGRGLPHGRPHLLRRRRAARAR